jgi:hypothetical protein
MRVGFIFGRLTAYVPIPGMMNDGDVAQFFPCEGEDFDIIFYDPDFKNITQAILHEQIHALFYRIGFGQTDLSSNMEEQICESISVFILENYNLSPKV